MTVEIESLARLSAGALRTLVYFWATESPADPMTPGDIDLDDLLRNIRSIAAMSGFGESTLRAHIQYLARRGWTYEAHGKRWLRRAVISWPQAGVVAARGPAPRRVVTDHAARKRAREEFEVYAAIEKLGRLETTGNPEIFDVFSLFGGRVKVSDLHARIYRLGARGLISITGTNLVVLPPERQAVAIPIKSGRKRGRRGSILILSDDTEALEQLREDAR